MEDTVRIPLGSRKYPGLYALIDKQDEERVRKHKWHPRHDAWNVYAGTRIKRADGTATTIDMHIFIAGKKEGMTVDHKNHDGLDNRRENLRHATKTQQCGNQRPQKGRSSRFKGVHWDKKAGRWQARIKRQGVKYNLGRFDNEEDAARAYDDAAREYFGEFARLNLP
jgi:hypothetical protein